MVENSKHFAKCLQDRGYHLVSGGTDTHLMLVDLKPKVTFASWFLWWWWYWEEGGMEGMDRTVTVVIIVVATGWRACGTYPGASQYRGEQEHGAR